MSDTIITTTHNLSRIVSDAVRSGIELFQRESSDPDKLYTRREVADLFGLEYRSIRRMIERGSLVTTADGRFITQKSINNYLKKNCLGSAGEQPGPMPGVTVSLQDVVCSCRQVAGESGVKSGSLPRSGPHLPLQKTRARAEEKNPKSIPHND